MSMSGPAIDLRNAYKTVSLAWDDAREVWQDKVRHDFENNQWAALENHVHAVLSAMDRLTPVLAKAVRDCS